MAANKSMIAASAGGTPESARAQARERAAEFLLVRHRWRWGEALPWLIAIAAFILLPDRMTFGGQVLIMVMFALSLDLILGYAGIVTLGHAAFFGIGAYTVGLLIARFGWSEPLSGLVAAAAMAALIGFVSGWFLLRYRGLTLLMLTLATAIMLQETGNLRSDISGGYDGLPGLVISPLFGVFNYDLYGHVNYLYVLGVLAAIFYVVRRIVYSPFGQALTGIRENVRRMHAIGSPVHRRLVTVYTVSAAIAGVAGALFTQTNAFVTLTVFDFDNSAKVMVMLILGGTGRLYGAFVGAVVYMVLEDYFSKLSPTFWQFGIGLLLGADGAVRAPRPARTGRGRRPLSVEEGQAVTAALQVERLNCSFGALHVTRDVDLTLERGARSRPRPRRRDFPPDRRLARTGARDPAVGAEREALARHRRPRLCRRDGPDRALRHRPGASRLARSRRALSRHRPRSTPRPTGRRLKEIFGASSQGSSS